MSRRDGCRFRTTADKVFRDLTRKYYRDRKPLARRVLSKNLRKFIVNNAKKKLRSSLNLSRKSQSGYNDTLLSGIRLGKLYVENENYSMRATIKSTKKKGSGSFRLNFFENAGNERFTKKGYSRGVIRKGVRFFGNTIDANLSALNRQLLSDFEQEFDKIFK